MDTSSKIFTFEEKPVPAALLEMAIPAIVSQLIILVYNIGDIWFIGRTNNPYMVAACSLSATVFMTLVAISNFFGVGGGTLTVQLLGQRDEDEARRAASVSLILATATALGFSLICLVFMSPILRVLGASDNTIGYASQYMFCVVVIGGVPAVLSNTMSSVLRSIGYSKEGAFGLSMGGIINLVLDPLFMFVLMPDGYQVMGAALATLTSNIIALIYYIVVYRRLGPETVLGFPKGRPTLRRKSLIRLLVTGFSAAIGLVLFDLCVIVINTLSAGHGDIQLAAIGIVLKIERLPLNTGIGICLGMTPLVAYNYASKNYERMRSFFKTAKLAGLVNAVICVILYRIFARLLVRAFIGDEMTVMYGTQFLQARCFATPFMFLSFNIFHYMQASGRPRAAMWMVVIRQAVLNIPLLFILNHIFGMTGIIWSQLAGDVANVTVSYIMYYYLERKLENAAG